MDSPIYNIIIADTQPIVIQGIKSLLNDSPDHQIVGTVDNENELFSLLGRTEANIVLIDLNLPRTNIYSLIKQIINIFPQLKIIVFTNYTMPKLVQSMMEYGVHAYLNKSAKVEEIVDTIKRVHEGEQLISPSVYNSPSNKVRTEKGMEHMDNFTKFTALTERETDIISLLSKGMTNKEMAQELNISIYTVETHRKNLMKKLKLKTSAQLVYLATLQGLV